jgi:hypothetical protein
VEGAVALSRVPGGPWVEAASEAATLRAEVARLLAERAETNGALAEVTAALRSAEAQVRELTGELELTRPYVEGLVAAADADADLYERTAYERDTALRVAIRLWWAWQSAREGRARYAAQLEELERILDPEDEPWSAPVPPVLPSEEERAVARAVAEKRAEGRLARLVAGLEPLPGVRRSRPDSRREALLAAVRAEGGRWTTGRVLALYRRVWPGACQRRTARMDLRCLEARGHLVVVEGPRGRVYVRPGSPAPVPVGGDLPC